MGSDPVRISDLRVSGSQYSGNMWQTATPPLQTGRIVSQDIKSKQVLGTNKILLTVESIG
jgi:hypothetical protein